MSELKWVDLSRFGAKLELVVEPSLQKRRLRLCIDDAAKWRVNTGGNWTEAGQIAALQRMGFAPDVLESSVRSSRHDGREVFVCYSDILVPTSGGLQALCPTLHGGDFVSVKPQELRGEPFQHHTADDFRSAIAAARHPVNFRFGEANRPVPLDAGQYPKLWVPAKTELLDQQFYETARDRNIAVSVGARSALRNPPATLLRKAWTRESDCYAALELDASDRSAVREVDWPFQIPVACGLDDGSIFVLPDGRLLPCDPTTAAADGLLAHLAARERLLVAATNVVSSRELSDAARTPASPDALLSLGQAVAQLDGAVGDLSAKGEKRQPEDGAEVENSGTVVAFQSLARRFAVAADQTLVNDALLVHQALAARYAAMEREIALGAENSAARRLAAMRGAIKSAYEQGLSYLTDVSSFVARQMRSTDDARPLDLGEVKLPSGVGGDERRRVNIEWTGKVAAAPRGAYARIGEVRDGDVFWRHIVSAGEGRTCTGAAADKQNCYVPEVKLDFEAIYAQMIASEVYDIGKSVRQQMDREKDAKALAELLVAGMQVTDTFKPVNGYIAGEMRVSSVLVTAFDAAAGTVSFEFRQPRRPVQRRTIGAGAFQKDIGLSPAARAPWQMTRDKYFHDEMRVRRDVGADRRVAGGQEWHKVSYAYVNPGSAGPFKGVVLARTGAQHHVGSEMDATFGRARVTSVVKLRGDDLANADGYAIDRIELLELGKEFHRRSVGDALEAGSIVPQNVLAEYPDLVVATLREGSLVRFMPSDALMARFGGPLEGIAVEIMAPEGDLGARVRLMLDEFSPSDGQLVQHTVAIEDGRLEVIERASSTASKQPWEMTRAEWNSVRNALRPDFVQSRFTRASGAEAVARAGALERHTFGVRDADRERHLAAQRGEISIPRDEHIEMLERLKTEVVHREVVEKALRDKRPVPIHVVAEYEDLLATERARRWAGVTPVSATVGRGQSVRASADSKVKIEDVGEKIGGARKDFYAKRMTVEDLSAMNDFERRTLVTKKNVWAPLDYEAMRREGFEPQAAYAVKWIKDKINQQPDKVEHCEAYVTAVGLIRDALETARTVDEVRDACARVRTKLEALDPGTIGYSYTWSSAYHAALGRDAMALIVEPRSATYSAGYRTAHNTSWAKLIRPTTEKSGDAEAQAKYRPDRPHLDCLERVGTDWRNGRDVTGAELLEAFGFRGIEYGNWLPQDERQAVLNHAYDAFMDLAEAVGLPPNAMSLGNELAIAFGARGKGRYAAHFEPARFVVNMTRLKGAGSVAHEWGHALDRWLALTGKTAGLFMTSSVDSVSNSSPEHLRVMKKAMQELSMRPISIDEAIAKASNLLVNAAQRTISGITGWARHGTGFHGDEAKLAAGQSFAASVQALVSNAFQVLTAEKVAQAIETRSLAELRDEYVATRVPEKILELYRLNGGTERSYLKKSSENVRIWFEAVSHDIAKMDRLLTAKADGAVHAPMVHSRRAADGEYLDLEHGKTVFHGAAKALDAKRKKPYFSEPEEMFARAFESFVFDEIAAKGQRSDYLVHGVEQTRFASGYAGNPYPVGDERQGFNANLREAMHRLRPVMEAEDEGRPEEAMAANL